VILQIVPYARRIQHDIDAMLAQQLRGPDAGELQQLGRVIRAARNQYFLSRPRCSQSTLLAVLDGIGTASSNRMRCASAEVSMRRLFRPLAGRRYATAVLALRPAASWSGKIRRLPALRR